MLYMYIKINFLIYIEFHILFESAWIPKQNINDYSEFKDRFRNKNKTSCFQKAVEEIEEALRPFINKLCLKEMSIDTILCTWEENSSMLKALYESRANTLDILNRGNGMDYLTILHRILTSEQQQQMY